MNLAARWWASDLWLALFLALAAVQPAVSQADDATPVIHPWLGLGLGEGFTGSFTWPNLLYSPSPAAGYANRLSSLVSWLVKPSFCIWENSSLCIGSSVTSMRTVSPSVTKSTVMSLS
jgi:hypothetical protein